MDKRLFRIIGGLILILILIFMLIRVYDNHLHQQEDLNSPSLLGSYWDTGYYKIDPKTILMSLASEDTDAFEPLLDDPENIEELTDITIHWTQADYLKIASALGEFVWSDPMDLKNWSVYYIYLEGSCDNLLGFNFASITYFKAGKKSYTTRLIEIDPYFGLVRWGDGKTYSQPILEKWKGVDLLESKVTADEALRIVNQDVKKRIQIENYCGVILSTPQNNDPNSWYLKIFPGSLDYVTYIVNPDTGEYTMQMQDN